MSVLAKKICMSEILAIAQDKLDKMNLRRRRLYENNFRSVVYLLLAVMNTAQVVRTGKYRHVEDCQVSLVSR